MSWRCGSSRATARTFVLQAWSPEFKPQFHQNKLVGHLCLNVLWGCSVFYLSVCVYLKYFTGNLFWTAINYFFISFLFSLCSNFYNIIIGSLNCRDSAKNSHVPITQWRGESIISPQSLLHLGRAAKGLLIFVRCLMITWLLVAQQCCDVGRDVPVRGGEISVFFLSILSYCFSGEWHLLVAM
jgi:hypothetical protein